MSTATINDVEEIVAVEPVQVEAAPQKISWFKHAMPTIAFLGRRLLSSAIVLLGATFIVFMALSYSLDFLEDLRTSTDPNVELLIAQRIQLLNLDTPPFIRYFQWLGNVLTGDLGTGWNQFVGQPVSQLLGQRIPSTVSLVLAATIGAIVFGILVGIVSALRQYTRFDYGVTFMSFVLFSLPSFWVAVLLKTWGAIGFNDFLNNPHFSWPVLLLVPLLLGGLLSAIIGGTRRTRWISFAVAALASFVVMWLFANTGWLNNPSLGIPGVTILGLGVALALVGLMVGFNKTTAEYNPDVPSSSVDGVTERLGADGVVYDAVDTSADAPRGIWAWMKANRALMAALTTVLVGAALYVPLQFVFWGLRSWWMIILLALVAALVGMVIGWLWGGYDRRLNMRVAALTALGMGMFIFVDRVMQMWRFYSDLPQIRNRPIATIGSTTPGVATSPIVAQLGTPFWVMQLDAFTHVLLPTLALVLISFAGYTRYTRASMLEVMNQDYIRTARAKGLPERVVTVRHAFRNALIPLATIIPLDFAGLLGGAVITEQIFGWTGMGHLFITAMRAQEVNVIMGYFLLIGTMLVIGTIVVDFVYALVDPRIRVNA